MLRPSRWFPLLLVCAATTLPAVAASAATSAPPPAIQALLLPCDSAASGSPCRVDPAQIQVDIPTGGSIQAVELSWAPDANRPSLAPSPASQHAILTVAKGANGPASGCEGPSPAPANTTATCWNWPSSLDYTAGATNWLLNGTYSVVACSSISSSNQCTASSQYSAAPLTVAVAPSPPTQVTTTESNGKVTVGWNLGPEPDLVGYTVSRNTQVVYTCSTNSAGLDASSPCTNPPSFSEQPGSGGWAYTVTALRFGADSAAADYVASTGSQSSVYVPAPPPPPSGGAAGSGLPTNGGQSGRAFLPPLPAIGTMRPAQMGLGGVGANAVPSIADTEDSGGVSTGTPAALPYNDNPALNGTLASGTHQSQLRPKTNSIDTAAELALAALALALAVHIWYVRGELRVASIRVAARRASAGEAPG